MAGKRGPVPRGAYPNKSRVLSTRIRADTRLALERAAAASGKSLSQEIEHRLRRSFDSDRVISEKFGSRQNYALLRLIASLFDLAPGKTTSWVNDPENFDHIVHSINLVLAVLRPKGATSNDIELDQYMGNLNARGLAYDIGQADASMPPDSTSDLPFIKSDLGELADRLKSLEDDEWEWGAER